MLYRAACDDVLVRCLPVHNSQLTPPVRCTHPGCALAPSAPQGLHGHAPAPHGQRDAGRLAAGQPGHCGGQGAAVLGGGARGQHLVSAQEGRDWGGVAARQGKACSDLLLPPLSHSVSCLHRLHKQRSTCFTFNSHSHIPYLTFAPPHACPALCGSTSCSSSPAPSRCSPATRAAWTTWSATPGPRCPACRRVRAGERGRGRAGK